MSLLVSRGGEPKALSDLVKYELNIDITRRSAVFAPGDGAGYTVKLGQVLGVKSLYQISHTSNSNAGNGDLSDLALDGAASVGSYSLEALSDTVFAVFAPSGARLADATVGAPYSHGQIAFTITASTTPFAGGDSFTVLVSEADPDSWEYVPLDLSAVDGAQIPAAVSFSEISVPSGVSRNGLVLTDGPAIIVRNHMVFPEGATAAQKRLIEAELSKRGVRIETAI